MMHRSLKKIAAWWREYWIIMDLFNGDDSWRGVVRGLATIFAGFVIILGFAFVINYFKISATSIIIPAGFPLIMIASVCLIILGAWHFFFSLVMLSENLFTREKKEPYVDGRFQPFHTGHVEMIRRAEKR